MKKQITSEHFDTTDNLLSTDKETQITSSYFIVREGRKLLSKLGYEGEGERMQFAGGLLRDYADTLKALIKAEMLQKMKESIDNIDTFYR
jgi:hypothetical protein